MAAHPEDHVGDQADGEQADDRLQPLLLLLRQVTDSAVRPMPTPRHSTTAAPTPIHTCRSASLAALAAQEGRDDAHDQGGLEALTQA